METNDNDSVTILSALLRYKNLAKDPANHSGMIKDKTTINFLAYVLDNSNEEVLITSLDTLHLLSESKCCRTAIKDTFGVLESLNSLINDKNLKNTAIQEKAEKVLKLLKSPESPNKTTKGSLSKNKKVLTLHVLGLHFETQKELEDILMKKMKGVHSVIVDVEHQKCTVTVYDHVDPKNVGLIISENTDMEAQLVTKNKLNQEILVPLVEKDKSLDLEELPPYLDEQDSPVKEKAVRSTKDFRITASEWFCSAAGFLQRTLYW